MCWLLQETSKQINMEKSRGIDSFESRNNTQVYKARDLCRAFAEYNALENFRYVFFQLCKLHTFFK